MLLEPRDVDLAVEVTGVADDGAILHVLERRSIDDVEVTRHGDPHIGVLGSLGTRHHAIALHVRLESLERVDFADNDAHAHASGTLRQATAAEAVTAHHEGASRKQAIGRAHDAVERGLARAVAIIEEVLGVGVVDVERGVLERAGCGHGCQADDTGRRLLGAADDVLEGVLAIAVDAIAEVGTVVHRDLRLGIDDGVEVLVVCLGVLTTACIDLCAVVLDERGRRVVLGGERIARAQRNLGTAFDHRAYEIGGLGGHVQTRTDADSLEGTLLGKALANLGEYGHVAIGPQDARAALVGKVDVGDVVAHGFLLDEMTRCTY